MKNQMKWRFPSPVPVLARFYENVQETTNMLSRDIDATVQSFYRAPPNFILPDLAARGDEEASGRFKPARIRKFLTPKQVKRNRP